MKGLLGNTKKMAGGVMRRSLMLLFAMILALGTVSIPVNAITPGVILDFESAAPGPFESMSEDGFDLSFVGYGEWQTVAVEGDGNHVLKDSGLGNMYGAEVIITQTDGSLFYFNSLQYNSSNGVAGSHRIAVKGILPNSSQILLELNPSSATFSTLTAANLGVAGIPLLQLRVNLVSISSDYSVDNISLTPIDIVPPDIEAAIVPAPNADGWNNTDVMVNFSAEDKGGSGLLLVSDPVAVTTEVKDFYVEGTAEDNAGNTASAGVYVNIDKTLPSIEAVPDRPANADGWYNDDVVITFNASDEGGSELKSVTPPITVNSDGKDQLISGNAEDYAGNMASDDILISLDQVAPVIDLDGTEYSLSNTVYLGYIATGYDKHFHYSATDELSGFAAGTVPSGILEIPTDVPSLDMLYKTIEFTDLAGNTSTVTFEYKVISLEDLMKVLKPLADDKSHNKNSTIPIKLQLIVDGVPQQMSADNLTFTLELWKNGVKQIPNRTNKINGIGPAEFVLAGPNYDTYQYNLNTKGMTVGDYELKIYILGKKSLPEGFIGSVFFTIR